MRTFETSSRRVRPSATTSALSVWTEASGVYGAIRHAWYATATASAASTHPSRAEVSPTTTTRTAYIARTTSPRAAICARGKSNIRTHQYGVRTSGSTVTTTTRAASSSRANERMGISA